MNRILMTIAVIGTLLCACASAQTQPAEYHSAAELKERFAKLAQEAKAKNAGSSGADLGAYANHALKLSYRRASGTAEVHEHFADLFVVQRGSAVLITGGKLVEPKREAEGEIRGKEISGGSRQTLSPGDIIHVPANTPHQVMVESGSEFEAFVLKIRE